MSMNQGKLEVVKQEMARVNADILGSYAILLFTASDLASITSHIQLGIVFALAPTLHSFWSYFSTDLQ